MTADHCAKGTRRSSFPPLRPGAIWQPADRMDEEKLIVEVKNRSIIYDSSHRFYKYNYKKEIAWKDIAETVGVDGKSLKLNADKLLCILKN